MHPSREQDLREPDELHIEPAVRTDRYFDRFGNRCTRFLACQGKLRIWNSTLIEDSGEKDQVNYRARQQPVEELPVDNLTYLMNSRYCEVNRLSNIATELFGNTAPRWGRVQAIMNWIHGKVQFGYQYARVTRTALEAYTERVGVCRDFQHLAITFCRCMHIPARYATGYLGDIGVPASPAPMAARVCGFIGRLRGGLATPALTVVEAPTPVIRENCASDTCRYPAARQC